MFNIETMRRICTASIEDFRIYGDVEDTRDGQTVFIDRGASVLAVAHLDTVCPAKGRFYHEPKSNRVYTPTLDDRLGATIILDVLPRVIGTNFDILLTEGEEIGRSTAAHFKPARDYNWLVSFDRTGVDAVHYQYQSKDWLAALGSLDMKIEHGMFSDLSFMSHARASGVNIGCAYYRYHSPRAYANLRETQSQIEKFARFYAKFKDIRFEHTPETARGLWGSSLGSDIWADEFDYCDECGEEKEVYYCGSFLFCEECIDSFAQSDVPQSTRRKSVRRSARKSGAVAWCKTCLCDLTEDDIFNGSCAYCGRGELGTLDAHGAEGDESHV